MENQINKVNYWIVLSCVFFLIIVLFAVGGTVLYMKSYKPLLDYKNKTVMLQAPTSVPVVSESKKTSTASISTKDIDTSSWNTFYNKTQNITFKYPKQMIAEETENFQSYKDRWGIYLWPNKEEFDYCHQKYLPEQNKCLNVPIIQITRIEEIDVPYPESQSQRISIDNKVFQYQSNDAFSSLYYLNVNSLKYDNSGLGRFYSILIIARESDLHATDPNFAKILSTVEFIR